jgi:hypothetical protein
LEALLPGAVSEGIMDSIECQAWTRVHDDSGWPGWCRLGSSKGFPNETSTIGKAMK